MEDELLAFVLKGCVFKSNSKPVFTMIVFKVGKFYLFGRPLYHDIYFQCGLVPAEYI